jgi:general L-amino acid transport system permease protein
MATLTQTTPAPVQKPSHNLGAQFLGWARENVYATPLQIGANLFLLGAALLVYLGQLRGSPMLAVVIGTLWLFGALWVAYGALRHRPDAVAQWLQERLYNTPASALVTLIIALWVAAAVRGLLDWAIINASFAGPGEHTGATWGIVIANFKLFMTGQFPTAQLWRVWASVVLLLVLIGLSIPVYGPLRQRLRPIRPLVTGLWLISPILLWLLLRGGLGLPNIETRFWGGLLLTLVITVFALVLSFPLGVLLALGRRSQLLGIPAWITYPVIGLVVLWGLRQTTLPSLALADDPLEWVFILWPLWLALAAIAFQRFYRGNVVAAASTVYIEFVRGVPLITVLLMAMFTLPLFLPSDIIIENAFRAMWGFMFFSAAYLAENVRGGLQAIPKGQYEAAEALGLNTFQQMRFIILPQALRLVIPPMTGQFIGLFKDTSLVAIVGLFDLLNIANAVIAQPQWLGLRREAYFFITVIYYLGCYVIAAMGTWLERRTGLGQR